jgi:hypothetical protein
MDNALIDMVGGVDDLLDMIGHEPVWGKSSSGDRCNSQAAANDDIELCNLRGPSGAQCLEYWLDVWGVMSGVVWCGCCDARCSVVFFIAQCEFSSYF